MLALQSPSLAAESALRGHHDDAIEEAAGISASALGMAAAGVLLFPKA